MTRSAIDLAFGGSGASRHQADAPLLSGFGRGGRLFVLISIWTAFGLLFASHFRVYHRVDWPLALWWGLKDWYLWGALAPLAVWLTRRLRFSRVHAIRAILIHCIVAVGITWVHAALAVFLSSLVEGLGEDSFVRYVSLLFVKKYPLSFATYGAIAGISHLLIARRRHRDIGRGGGPPADGSPDPLQVTGAPTKRLLVQTSRGERFLDVDQIDRIEAAGNYVRIHAGGEAYLERRTLKSLASQLEPSTFLRIHRSHIVHVDRIDRIEAGRKGGYEVVLRDGTRLSLSRSYRSRLEERIGKTF